MYLGKIVEIAPAKELYNNPKHPYTEALLSAVPIPTPRSSASGSSSKGTCPVPSSRPPAAASTPRCSIRVPSCSENEQVLKEISRGTLGRLPGP
jgi:oligopeptide transport system ATP-binding protein